MTSRMVLQSRIPGDLITEMKLNDELSGELDALEGRRRLVLMDNFFLNTITP